MGSMVWIVMVVGEVFGDFLVSYLIVLFKVKLLDVVFYGIGGLKMQGQGFDVWWLMEKFLVMGYVDVLKNYCEIFGICCCLKKCLFDICLDIFIGVDVLDFNFGLEIDLKVVGIKIIYYVSLLIWVWWGGWIKKIVKVVNCVLVLFLMEFLFYENECILVKIGRAHV